MPSILRFACRRSAGSNTDARLYRDIKPEINGGKDGGLRAPGKPCIRIHKELIITNSIEESAERSALCIS